MYNKKMKDTEEQQQSLNKIALDKGELRQAEGLDDARSEKELHTDTRARWMTSVVFSA